MPEVAKKRQAITLLELLSDSASDDARELLRKYNKPDATGADLQMALAKLYADATDKVIIEKEFAGIHPHREFILKYNKAEKDAKQDLVDAANEELKSNCEGGCNGGCGSSSADGVRSKNISINIDKKTMLIVGGVALVGVVSFLIYKRAHKA